MCDYRRKASVITGLHRPLLENSFEKCVAMGWQTLTVYDLCDVWALFALSKHLSPYYCLYSGVWSFTLWTFLNVELNKSESKKIVQNKEWSLILLRIPSNFPHWMGERLIQSQSEFCWLVWSIKRKHFKQWQVHKIFHNLVMWRDLMHPPGHSNVLLI